jgi:hypothetical protein
VRRPCNGLLYGIGLWGFLAPACVPAREATPILFEKDRYQALYGARDGALQRIAYDENGDRRAETIVFFGPGGRIVRTEADGDGDGVLDRWEEYDEAGVLARAGRARKGAGPIVWVWVSPPDPDGLRRCEFDDDGDGRVDRVESLSATAIEALAP